MALIECPDCGQKVSDQAKVCIHCGCPLGEKGKTKNTIKLNTAVEKFKSVKKPYQIAIVAGIAVVVIILLVVLLSSTKTPLDGIQDRPSIETVRKRYGEADKVYSDALMYFNYKWLGYSGSLDILFDNSEYVKFAGWAYKDDNDAIKAFNKMQKALNKKFGKGEAAEGFGGGLPWRGMIWYDNSGNKYELRFYSEGVVNYSFYVQ